MDKDIALKKAIDALDFKGVRDSETYWKMMNEAIQACKEALEQPASKNIRDGFNEMLEDKVAYYKGKQPAQEPVAWMSEGGIFTRTKEHAEIWSNNGGKVTPVYTHPAPSWQGLSDNKIISLYAFYGSDTEEAMLEFARAIENALKEKNYGNH